MALFTGCTTPDACAIAAVANAEADVVMIDPKDDVADEPAAIKSWMLLECCPAFDVTGAEGPC